MFATDLRITDCHCDTTWRMGKNDYDFSRRNSTGHLDLPRLLEGGVGLQFFAVCTAPLKERSCLHAALQQIGHYHRALALNSHHLHNLEHEEDLAAAEQKGKIGTLLALEGAEPLEGSLELLEIFYILGVRALSLTWNHRNHFADGVGEKSAAGGLTRAGRKLVQELSRKGIILDLAHLAPRCFFEALELTERPPLVSHANARELCDHPRNLSDKQLKALAARGGVIGMSFCPYFITGEAEASLEQLIDHFIYVAALVGVEHLAFGSDFDGIEKTVTGIPDAAAYPALLEALCKRGFHSHEVELIARSNVERILRENLGKRAPP
ncbi:MAG: dipeptidase [Dethiobacteria bacterium]|jgi:membrane dipeptidase|nr:dipeptidase [Bacillota bacterium]HOB29433.1 dipeptidase [Bacillota bacterium]HPZ42061.1 dipeptidase [Bacillota bacterium]HQD52939.1 dipeptidase [Bacillota bacterium]